MMKMIQKKRYSSGFSLFILLACLFFLAIFITTSTTASSVPIKPRGIAAISLTSHSEAAEQQQQDGIKCKTEQGEDVDWFIAYKLPKIRTSSNALVRAGLAYAYILPSPSGAAEKPSQTATTEGNTAEARSNVSASNRKNAVGHKGSFSGGRDNLNNNATAITSFGNKDGDFGTEAVSVSGMYTTARGQSPAWTLSSKGIDSPGSIVGQTVGKLYVKGTQDAAFLTYNDQPPVGPTIDSGAHSKGIIVTSLASGGIWIQHSVPHFPLIDSNNYHYQYPKTGEDNGQIFHCISFSSTKEVDDLAKIFEITKPHIVNFTFPTDAFKNALPQLMSIVNHRRHLENQENNQSSNQSIASNRSASRYSPKGDNNDNEAITIVASEVPQLPCANEIDENACLNGIKNNTAFNKTNEEATVASNTKNWDIMEIRSAGGKSFKAYIKGPSFHEDIYSSWIAPAYNTKLDVQSWLNGRNPFVSNCSTAQYSVYNILNKNIAGQAFSTHHDHSKWAVSLSNDQPLVCISDLNRMEHQLKRGGVAVCFADSTIWAAFSSSIIDVQPCPRLASTASSTPNNSVTYGTAEDISLLSSISALPLPNMTSSMERDDVIVVSPVAHIPKRVQVQGESKSKKKTRHQQHHQRHRLLERKVKSRAYSLTTT